MISTASFRRITNIALLSAATLSAALTISILLYITVYVFFQGVSYINLDFFTHPPKPLGEAGGGAANSLIGSALMVGMAALIGIPTGLGVAIFVAEYAGPRVGSAVRFLADILSGIPSIVVGIFVYEAIVVRTGHFSGYAGGAALAIIMLPIVARSSEEMLKLVPISQREAALALGIARWRSVVNIVLPAARAGLVTGSLLAVSRAAGETAPLLFTSLGNRFVSTDLGSSMDALPLHIYRYAIGPYDEWHQQAWAAAFFLIVLVLVLNLIARFLAGRTAGGRA